MRTFNEPTFLSDRLVMLNDWMHSQDILIMLVPHLADTRVFLYPLLLVVLYITGIAYQKKIYKTGALALFTSAIGIFVFNNIIKFFFQRPRPYLELALPTPEEELILSDIPTDSFPSDHAAMAATIAMGLFLRAHQSHNIFYKRLSYFFALIAIIMGIGRVTIGVHWPTDIIVGSLVGVGVAYFVFSPHGKKVFSPLRDFLIKIEKKISGAIGIYS